jgi:hypothetical protein
MNFLLELISETLAQMVLYPLKRTTTDSLLEPVPAPLIRAQDVHLRNWAERNALTKTDRDTWTGRVGRFTVEIRTFNRAEGTLPMRLTVSPMNVQSLPQDRASACANRGESEGESPWHDLFDEFESLQRIRASSAPDCAEFRMDWNAAPETLGKLFQRLEERCQQRLASYR